MAVMAPFIEPDDAGADLSARLLADAATIMGTNWLRAKRDEAFAVIAENYQSDPGSLIPVRELMGDFHRWQIHLVFDKAFHHQAVAPAEALARLRELFLEQVTSAAETQAYLAQRGLDRQRAEDEAAILVFDLLANDKEFQVRLVERRESFERTMELRGIEHHQTVELRGIDQPYFLEKLRLGNTVDLFKAMASAEVAKFKALAEVMGAARDEQAL